LDILETSKYLRTDRIDAREIVELLNSRAIDRWVEAHGLPARDRLGEGIVALPLAIFVEELGMPAISPLERDL
jgi:hypothetical protein